MAQGALTRRRLATLIGAGVLWSPGARGAILMSPTASRLIPPGSSDAPYAPPTNLATVADVFRRMTAAVMVNGQGPFAFVVDTGANQSVVSDVLALQLGLPVGPSQALNGVAGVQQAPTTVATLKIGDRSHADVVLSVLPAEAIGGAGILGLDRMEGQRLTIDFRRQMMRIEAQSPPSRHPDDFVLKAHRRDGQLTLVDADLAGVKLVAFLDSGAQNTIGNMALRALAITRHPTSLWSQTPVLSATSQTIMAQMADLPRLRVGTLELPFWPVAFADLHTFRMWNLIDKPAILLGMDVLSRFEYVSLDFARDEVRFRLPRAS